MCCNACPAGQPLFDGNTDLHIDVQPLHGMLSSLPLAQLLVHPTASVQCVMAGDHLAYQSDKPQVVCLHIAQPAPQHVFVPPTCLHLQWLCRL